MKNLEYKKLILPVLLSLSVTGCDFFDSDSDEEDDIIIIPVEPKPPTPVPPEDPTIPNETVLIVNILNADTEAVVTSGTLSILDDQINVVPSTEAQIDFVNGQATYTLDTTNLVDNDQNGFPDFAANLSLSISASGYLSSNEKIVVDIYGENTATITLLPLTAESTPEGVELATESVDLSDSDSITNEAGVEVVAISTEAEFGANLSMVLPVNTQMFDDEGKELDTSMLEVVLTSFDPTVETAADLLPGGAVNQISNSQQLADALSTGNNEVSVSDAAEVRFVSAGFVAIELTAGEQKASKLNAEIPITVNIPLSSAVTNPTTGTYPQVDDIIPIWSLSDGDLSWRYESDGIIAANNSGNLFVETAINHLSYYNLAWADVEEACSGSFQIVDVEGNPFPLRGEIFLDNERVALIDNYNGATDGIYTFVDLPDEPTKLTFVSSEGSVNIVADKTTLELDETGSIDTQFNIVTGIDLCATSGSVLTLQQVEQPTPVIYVSSYSTSTIEGNDENPVAQFTVKLFDGPEDSEVSFQYDVISAPQTSLYYAHGSAIDGQDFNAVTEQVITFAAGETSKVIEVPILADTEIEKRNKQYQVVFSNAEGAIFSLGRETVTANGIIRDDDAIFIESIEVVSADEESGKAVIEITTEFAVPVIENYRPEIYLEYLPHNAEWLLDYQVEGLSRYQRIELTQGETVTTTTIDIRDDLDVEVDEVFKVSSSASNYYYNDLVQISDEIGEVTGTIIDNDTDTQPATGFTVEEFGSDTLLEGSTNWLLVSLNSATDTQTTLEFTKQSQPSGVETSNIVFAPGQSTNLISVAIPENNAVGFDYDLTLNLSDPTDTISDEYSKVFSVIDDDYYYVSVGFYQDALEIVEGETEEVGFNVSYYSQDPSLSLVTSFSVADTSTATQGVDFTGGDASFALTGENMQTGTTVTIIDDDISEPSETVELDVSLDSISTTGKTLVDFGYDRVFIERNENFNDLFTFNQQLIIGNDDIATMYVKDYGTLQLETDNGAFEAFSVDVNLEIEGGGLDDTDLVFEVSTINGTAEEGVHFSAPAGTITLPAGETSVQIEVPTLTPNVEQVGITEIGTSSELNFAVVIKLSQATRDALAEKDIQYVVTKKQAGVNIKYTYIDPDITGGTGGSAGGGTGG